jgi:alkyldihydroxyacetonephosphate synthase
MPAQESMRRARELAVEHGGQPQEPREGGGGEAWKNTFLRAPHLRDMLLQLGVVAETFETAITWERFPEFHAQVAGAAREALGGEGMVTCRFTHAYQDGPAPYFTVLMPARRGEEVEQWWAVKRAASDAIDAAGGTITHHHAVGRDHRPWYDRQRPEPFAAALRGAKAAVDPQDLLNPGVLV